MCQPYRLFTLLYLYYTGSFDPSQRLAHAGSRFGSVGELVTICHTNGVQRPGFGFNAWPFSACLPLVYLPVFPPGQHGQAFFALPDSQNLKVAQSHAFKPGLLPQDLRTVTYTVSGHLTCHFTHPLHRIDRLNVVCCTE